MSQAVQNRAFDPMSPFFRAEAHAAGMSSGELLSGRFHKVFHGIYVSSSVPITGRVRAQAALRVMPKASHLSHHTAVQLWGGVAPDRCHTHVSVGENRLRSVRQGIQSHKTHPDAQVTTLRGLAVSSPAQAFIELAALGVALVDLVIAGDSLVKATRLSPGRFVQAAKTWSGRGARLARRAARLVRSRVDSPMETRLRLLIVWAGLPEPEVNWAYRDADGEVKMRLDLCYRDYKVLVEYDGRQHAEDDQQWGRDIERRELLDQLGWRLVIVRSADIYLDPERTLQRIRSALREHGAAGLPKRFKPEYQRHFPGRA